MLELIIDIIINTVSSPPFIDYKMSEVQLSLSEVSSDWNLDTICLIFMFLRLKIFLPVFVYFSFWTSSRA